MIEMLNYIIEVIIENKRLAKDPEGETVYRELVNKGGYDDVISVRSGKYLRFVVSAQSHEEAKKKIDELCNDLRIYNPIVHSCKISVRGNIT